MPTYQNRYKSIFEANGAGVPGITCWIYGLNLSTNLSPSSPTAGYVSCDEDDPNGIESSTNDATGQSLPDSGTVVSPESLRPTNRSPAVATSGALPIKNTLAPPPVPLTSMEKHA
nr:uncharacterized protein LOC118876888 [Drosophila suzukii]